MELLPLESMLVIMLSKTKNGVFLTSVQAKNKPMLLPLLAMELQVESGHLMEPGSGKVENPIG